MIRIARRKIDISVVVGVVVVFTIIAAVIIGAWYFLIKAPADRRLEDAKADAQEYLSETLGSRTTSQAATALASYTTQIQNAGSTSEVAAIRSEATVVNNRESIREDLLTKVDGVANGTYYTATGAGGTIHVTALGSLSETLKTAINALQETSELEDYESEIYSQATSTWRTFFKSELDGLGENLAMFRNSPVSGGYISKANALAKIDNEWAWETLSKLKFENVGSVEVPVLDTFQRTPTIKSGSKVNIYVYDSATEGMSVLWTDVTVGDVIYSQADIATIAWTLTDGETSESYSVNMWETIKAAAAGDAEAAAVGWSGYGSDLMSNALSANLGDYAVSVIYSVEVPEEIGELIAQYEFHMSATKDVILIAKV